MYTNVPDNVVDKDFFYLFYLKWLSSFMIILLRLISGWVDVEWDSGAKNSYRYGKDSAFDIKVTHTKHFLYSVVYCVYCVVYCVVYLFIVRIKAKSLV